MSISILYEDKDVMVINKPAGLMVHTDGRSAEDTVVDWFLEHVPDARGVGEPQTLADGTPLERSGVVHRLDRDTSGALILAKNQDAFVHLKAQFHDRHAKKEYRAFVYGTMKENEGTIERPIGRSSRDGRLRSAEYGARGLMRAAVTNWECIAENGTHAYLKLMPKTGRTHQLRVHLKAIGRPIVGDTLYAPKALLEGDNLGISGLALHAYALTITLPNGKEVTFTAPLPSAFEAAADRIAKS